jgi:tetratricopeptide (TPR) repeat protein
MSVLLDALKKAAEEKRAKGSSSRAVDSALTNSRIPDNSKSETKAAVPFTLSIHEVVESPKDELRSEPEKQADDLSNDHLTPEFERHDDKPTSAIKYTPNLSLTTEIDSNAASVETVKNLDKPSVQLDSNLSKKPKIELKLAEPEPTVQDYCDPLENLDQSVSNSENSSNESQPVNQLTQETEPLNDISVEVKPVQIELSKKTEVSERSSNQIKSFSTDTQNIEPKGKFKDEQPIKPEPKQVKKLFAPTLTTTFKTPRSLYGRKVFYLFLSLSTLVLLLGYYALFTFNKLEQEYQQQAVSLQSPGLVTGGQQQKFVGDHQEQVLNKQKQNDQDVLVPDMKSLAEKVEAEEQVKEKLTEKNQQPKQQKTEAHSQPQTKLSQPSSKNYQIRQAERVSESELAYQAYLQGDYKKAQYHYQRTLDQESDKVTGLIGLAAIHAEQGSLLESLSFYQQALKHEPGNTYALEGMAAVATQIDQTLIDEFELKNLVRQYPMSDILQLAMGNFYASKNDWFQAQPYYFESVKLQPKDPNHRLNLAVSLDHLGQYESALVQYKMTLALSDNQAVAFDPLYVKRRVEALEVFVGGANG